MRMIFDPDNFMNKKTTALRSFFIQLARKRQIGFVSNP